MVDSPSINLKNAAGSWYLKPIFYEMCGADKSLCLYSLKTEDHKVGKITYPSLRRLYLEMDDESEYLFAEKYFGGWPHWKRLLSCSWFQDYISDIREELAVRNSAKNLLQIRKKAEEGNLQANRYLLEQAWKPKESVGRPSKARIRAEADKLFHEASDVDLDLSRLLDNQVFTQ
jgi:hypothetical protein